MGAPIDNTIHEARMSSILFAKICQEDKFPMLISIRAACKMEFILTCPVRMLYKSGMILIFTSDS